MIKDYKIRISKIEKEIEDLPPSAMMTQMKNRNFYLMLVTDMCLFALAFSGAYLIRFDFGLSTDMRVQIAYLLPVVVPVKTLTFLFMGLYRGMWRYSSLSDMWNLLKATALSSLLIFSAVLFLHRFSGYSRCVFIIDGVLTFLFTGGLRVMIRFLYHEGFLQKTDHFDNGLRSRPEKKPVILVGAGDAGEMTFREIMDNPSLKSRVVAFVDDDPAKKGRLIHGVPVRGAVSDLPRLVRQLGVQEIFITAPSATGTQMRRIVEICEQTSVPFKTLPGLGDLIHGRVSIKALRDVSYTDLLGREPVKLDEARIGAYLEGATVLVTGAGGSIGSELCRQICRFRPETIVLFDRAESPLHEIDIELKRAFPHVRVLPVLGDICDRRHLSAVFEACQPRVVFHAAAYKHVPMLELQPWKAITNNVLGTSNMIEISRQYGVERFVFVSTDKAVRPANIMGASKRVAELLVHGQNGCRQSDGKFMAVRFGNVVGSVGSVVPLFRKQIAEGGPVTVTHPGVTRYFMTIAEACQLILQAGSMGKGGETFILDMGTPVKISDMARDLIRLSGYEPGVDIEIEYVGLRPGEKLFEELITRGEGIERTRHEKIMVLRGRCCNQKILNGHIGELRRFADAYDSKGIRAKLHEIEPEFNPGENNEMDGHRLVFPDRRRKKRVRPGRDALVSVYPGPEKGFRICDISNGGLSFYYHDSQDVVPDSGELAVCLTADGSRLENIPCRMVSRRTLTDSDPIDNGKTRRLSVMFERLTAEQSLQLEFFVRNLVQESGH